MKKRIIILIIVGVCLVLIGQKIKSNNEESAVEFVDNTTVITEEDIEYLNSLGYIKSEYFDVYYENTENDSGVSITSSEIDIDWDTSISGYDLDLTYETNIKEELVDVIISKDDEKIGYLTITEFDKPLEIALDIDQKELNSQLNTFVTNSQKLVVGLSGDYNYDDLFGTPVHTLITFYDYTPTGKVNRNGYETCEIEYYTNKCYVKDNDLYLSGDSSNTVILETPDYRLGYRKAKVKKLKNDEYAIDTNLNLEIDSDSIVEIYELNDLNNLEYLQNKYEQPITESYEQVQNKYNTYEEDFNNKISL